MARPVEILEKYLATIKKVVVTYHDNETKDFSPNEWYLFEERVIKVAKEIQIINI
jgi:hypothetical protein